MDNVLARIICLQAAAALGGIRIILRLELYLPKNVQHIYIHSLYEKDCIKYAYFALKIKSGRFLAFYNFCHQAKWPLKSSGTKFEKNF